MSKLNSLLEKIGFSAEEVAEEEDNETYTEPKSEIYSQSSRRASDIRLSVDDESEEDSYRSRKNAVRATSPSIYERPSSERPASSAAPKVVNLRASVQMEVVVSNPESFDEAKSITDDLKDYKPVVINLEFVDHEIAQRITDFLCGACYALGGSIQKIADKIYMIAPGNVDIAASTDFRRTLQNEGGLHFPLGTE